MKIPQTEASFFVQQYELFLFVHLLTRNTCSKYSLKFNACRFHMNFRGFMYVFLKIFFQILKLTEITNQGIRWGLLEKGH